MRSVITAAVRQCVIDWPRLATTLLRLDPREKSGIETIAVDQHLRLYYDPEWIKEQKFDDLVFFIKQEVIHPLLGHAERSQKILGDLTGPARKYVQEKLNIAADCSVHAFMSQENQFISSKATVPSDCTSIKTETPLVSGLSLEEYFVHLFDREEMENLIELEQAGGVGGGGDDTDIPDRLGNFTGPLVSGHNGGSGADGEQRGYEDEYEPEQLGDNERSDGSGGVSEGDLDQLSDDFIEGSGKGSHGGHGRSRNAGKKKPKLTPEQLIRMAVGKSANVRHGFDEPTYRRPNRRSHDSELIRPSYQQRSPSITVVVDTSGSMNQRDLDLAAGVLEVALKGMQLDALRVVMADHEIQTDAQVSSLRDVEFVGGGGTSMDDVCDEIALNQRNETDLLVCVTDGETSWPSSRKVPMVAAITRNRGDWWRSNYPVPSHITEVEIFPR